jgi:hypothetical protein
VTSDVSEEPVAFVFKVSVSLNPDKITTEPYSETSGIIEPLSDRLRKALILRCFKFVLHVDLLVGGFDISTVSW